MSSENKPRECTVEQFCGAPAAPEYNHEFITPVLTFGQNWLEFRSSKAAMVGIKIDNIAVSKRDEIIAAIDHQHKLSLEAFDQAVWETVKKLGIG